MKLTPSMSSVAKLITLLMAILRALIAINTPAAHATPVINDPPAVNGIQAADPEAPRAPVGPHGPLLTRRGTSVTGDGVEGTTRLGKTHSTAVEKPEPSGGVELSMNTGHAKKRFVPEGGGRMHTSHGVAKRDDNEEMWEHLGKAWWMQKRQAICLAGEEKNAAAVNKRGGEEEAEPGWWVWNDKRETDNARGFEIRELAKTHNKGKSNGMSKREGGEGDEDSRWEFKREIHQGGAKEHSGWIDSFVEWDAVPERQPKPEQKKRKREITKRNVNDWSDASATAGSQKEDLDESSLEKRKFRGWHFKREEEGGEVGAETGVEADAKVEGEGRIEFEKRRWHW
ncbi:hypothetical protein BG015_010434 [Linnemannia schmuckeri]|uniref:Uncharacterized protein n=1 Tax=Linnemannia schmuckeri TaxID=64567 RepID=A0A9P5V930_9FUNG|nr:hypothetical protein BG015_010434 [Linnemannia schmuckeri]